MSATTMDAKRKLHSLARNGGNWRLKGMYLAELPKTEFTPKDLARAWPTKKSEYRFLGDEHQNHQHFNPSRTIALEEDSEGYRRLSDATKKSDWSESGDGVQEIHADKAIKRALAYGDTSEEFDTLWREQLFDTVIEGSRKNQIARDAATVINVETNSGSHPRGQDASFAGDLAEGEAIPDDREQMDDVTWDTTKFGQGARATDELIDHSLIDLIERQVEWLGRSCENAVNRVWLTELIDGADASNDVDSSTTANRDIAAVNEAQHQVELSDFQSDTLVTHPTYKRTLFNSNNLMYANQAGDDEALRNRQFNPLLDLDMVHGSNGVYDPDGSNNWDFSAAGDFGAVAYNRGLMGLYMYSDIQVKDYTDPVRDLEGVNARVSVDANYHQPASASRIHY